MGTAEAGFVTRAIVFTLDVSPAQ
ncbi:MAG: hypothetical protein RJA49_2188, partial [Actinomycetota bacterium]